MRFTPVYNLPALDERSTGKDIYEQSWSIASELERVLLNTGQVPIGADLQSLLRRVTALESGAGPKIGGTLIRSSAAAALGANVWTAITSAGQWVAEQPLAGVTFDGRLTIQTDGVYQVAMGVKGDATASFIVAMQKNDTRPGYGYVLATTATGVASYTAASAVKNIPLRKGDKLGMQVFSNVATSLSNDAAEKSSTFMSLSYVEPIRTS